MKIDNSLKPVSNAPAESRARQTTTSPANAPDAKVELSSLSGRLAQLEQTLRDSPVVDTAKVEEIKQAMSDGRFKVNADKVADSLIESVRQMLTAQPRSA